MARGRRGPDHCGAELGYDGPQLGLFKASLPKVPVCVTVQKGQASFLRRGRRTGLYLDVNFLFANVPVSQKNFHVWRQKFPKSNYMYGSGAMTVTQIAGFSPDGTGLENTLTMFVVVAAAIRRMHTGSSDILPLQCHEYYSPHTGSEQLNSTC